MPKMDYLIEYVTKQVVIEQSEMWFTSFHLFLAYGKVDLAQRAPRYVNSVTDGYEKLLFDTGFCGHLQFCSPSSNSVSVE